MVLNYIQKAQEKKNSSNVFTILSLDVTFVLIRFQAPKSSQKYNLFKNEYLAQMMVWQNGMEQFGHAESIVYGFSYMTTWFIGNPKKVPRLRFELFQTTR